jgi:hypothetical protein
VVFNSAGSAESTGASLLVRYGPAVTVQPADVFVRIKPDPAAPTFATASFTPGISSFNPPVRYQWFFNGSLLAGATNSTLTYTNVQLANEGLYTVGVTDTVGSVASQPARLVPLIKPSFTVTPISQSVVTGAQINVNAAVSGNPIPFTWQWQRGSTTLNIYTNNDRFSFFSFTAPTNLVTNQLYRVVLTNLAGNIFVNFNVNTLGDSDRDGIPDAWEARYGFATNNAADGSQDFDGDGLSNFQEYSAGTDPTNSASSLRVSLAIVGGQPTVSFAAVSNRTYTIQYSDDLGTNVWSKLADVLAHTNNRVEAFPDPTWTTSRVYRAVVPRQP